MCCTAQALVTLRCKIPTGGHTSCGMCGVQSGQQQDASGGWFNGCGLGGSAALRGLPTAEVISRRVRSARPTHWVLRTTGTLASLRAGVPFPFPEGRLEEG